MTTWHHVRRIVSALVAGLVAAGLQGRGMGFGWAVLLGLAAAVITGGLIIPLLWRPPRPPS